MSFLISNAIDADNCFIFSYLVYFFLLGIVTVGFVPADFGSLAVVENDGLRVGFANSEATRHSSNWSACIEVQSLKIMVLVLQFLENRRLLVI